MLTTKDFIDATPIEIEGHKFIISRIPAFDAAPIYDSIVEHKGIIPQEDKLAILSRCAVLTQQGEVVLSMPTLINEYVPKFQILNKLIEEAFKLNFSFSNSGSPSQE